MKEMKFLAPVTGKVIPIESVPDEIFAQKMLRRHCDCSGRWKNL